MSELMIRAYLMVAGIQDTLTHRVQNWRETPERGSTSIQEVLWAVAAVTLATLVIGAVVALVRSKVSLIK